LLVTEEETPLQSIFIEQIAKIMSASSRGIWSELRERSGTLPSGRSVLGTIVDPLGLFRTSPVVRMNSLDEETIESTRNLINLLNEQSSLNEGTSTDVSNLSGPEVQQLASTLVSKVWNRRSGILKTGNRLGTKLLQLTADKLETGEREILILPSASTELKESDGKIHEETSSSNNSNDRVMNARMILQEAEREEAMN
jgi:hypothetical protein